MQLETKDTYLDKPSAVDSQKITQEEDTMRQKDPEKIITSSPPFLERLIIPRPIGYPDFDLLGELKNIFIKIPLLQAIQNILIYHKTIKELCVKKFEENKNNPNFPCRRDIVLFITRQTDTCKI